MKISSTVILKRGKEGSIKRLHPWIFSGAIQSIQGPVENGDWVTVTDASHRVLGHGHYQAGTIAVRVLTFAAVIQEETFWEQKIASAHQQRLSTGVISTATNAFRLIHAEGDGLPGLIIDVYGGVAVMQAYSIGMHRDRHAIASAIKSILGDAITAVYYKSLASSGKSESEYLFGMAVAPHVILEHGSKFYVDWEEGQKTGFFLDQRENRKLLASLSRDKTVLNTFCYTGGFSVYALYAGAKLVHSVDASEKAIDMTRKNLELNGYSSLEHACFVADTFDFFKESNVAYDLIVLDPPAFAKHKDARHQAMKGYQRLNAEAMRKIQPGGIILTFSCSQVIDRQLFYDTVVSAGLQSGRTISVLEHLSQPADHPVSLYHPEGAYLKGLVLHVS